MDPVLVGTISVALIVILIYCGSYVAITLSIVSFIGVWLLRGDMTIAMRMMTLAVTDSIKSYDFASIPTFVMMGLIVGKAGIGTDIYEVFTACSARARRTRGRDRRRQRGLRRGDRIVDRVGVRVHPRLGSGDDPLRLRHAVRGRRRRR
jgi:hypothetical protein